MLFFADRADTPMAALRCRFDMLFATLPRCDAAPPLPRCFCFAPLFMFAAIATPYTDMRAAADFRRHTAPLPCAAAALMLLRASMPRFMPHCHDAIAPITFMLSTLMAPMPRDVLICFRCLYAAAAAPFVPYASRHAPIIFIDAAITCLPCFDAAAPMPATMLLIRDAADAAAAAAFR